MHKRSNKDKIATEVNTADAKKSSEITQEDTFEAVIRLINLGYKPVALDFASSTNPGGGWRGKQKGTQEESLCRRSDLGLLLEKCKYPIPNDGLIYLPKVIISRNQDGSNLEPKQSCSIIASELKAIASHKKDYLRMRLEAIYQKAVKQGHDAIVLGAWGCGAFQETDEDPQILAEQFKIISSQYPIYSVFAIYGKEL